MKALSVKQPWAELLASGEKTIEVRTWRTSHRGPLAIVASSSDDADASEALGIEGPRGVAVAIVELVNVRPFRARDARAAGFVKLARANGASEAELVEQQLRDDDDDDDDDGCYAWIVVNARRVHPTPIRGRLNLYEVPDDIDRPGGSPAKRADALEMAIRGIPFVRLRRQVRDAIEHARGTCGRPSLAAAIRTMATTPRGREACEEVARAIDAGRR